MEYGSLNGENHFEGFDFDSFLTQEFDPDALTFNINEGGVEPVGGN